MVGIIVLMISLSALLQQSVGQPPEIASVSTAKADQQAEIVNKHNALRRSVSPTASNMLKMKWDPLAAENARKWAQKCTFSHSAPKDRTLRGIGCGENIFMSTALTPWSSVIQTWFDEEKDFQFGHGPRRPNAVIGHYTQVVWAKSYIAGCAAAYCPQHQFKYYYVCQYCPAGNMISTMNTPYKAGQPCGDCPNACDDKLCTNP